MKQLLFLFLILPFFGITQREQPALLYGKQENILTVKNVFKFPTGCGSPQGIAQPTWSDTSRAAIYFDSCGHSLWLYDPSTNVWNIFGGGSGDISKAGLAMTKNIDTLHAGGNMKGILHYYVPNPFVVGKEFGYMRMVNRVHSDSMNGYSIGSGGRVLINEAPPVVTGSYAPAMFSIERFLAEWLKDTANLQYGGIMNLVARRYLDSINSVFGPTATKKALWMSDPGIAITNQFMPTKDSLDLAVWQDGVTGAPFHAITGIGESVGYNFHIPGSFPYTTGFASTTDLMRVANRTRYSGITGAGISGFTWNYRDWQTTMMAATAAPTKRHYKSNITGFTAYGNTDDNTGTDLTKAQIFERLIHDTVTSFLSLPLWTATSPTKNGYSFRAMGDSDVLYNKGYTYFGPTLPTHDNGLWPQYRFNLIGDGYVDGSLWMNKAGRLVGGNTTPDFSTPNYLYLLTPSTDSSTNIYLGTSGGVIKVIPKYANDGNEGGVDMNVHYGNNVDAGFRLLTYSHTGVYEPRYKMQRNKFYASVLDSISFQAPAYKFAGMPTGAQAYVLMQDANGYTYRADTTGLMGGGGGSGSGTVNSGTQYRIAYYATTGTAVSEAGAITAARALISDVNGVPTHSTVTGTELAHLSGVTSAIQTQFGTKWGTSGNTVGANGSFIGTNDNFNFAIKANGKQKLLVSGTGAVVLGDTYANGPITQLHVKYDGSQSYGAKGLRLEDIFNGGDIVLQALSGNAYFTNAAGTATGITVASIQNPADGSTLTNASSYWKFNSTKLGIGITPTASHLAIAAGTTSVSSIYLENGVRLTTPLSGHIEREDALYFTKNGGASGIRMGIGGTLIHETSIVGNVDTGEDVLHTYSLLANTLSRPNDEITFDVYIAWTSGTAKLYFGATEIGNVEYTAGSMVRFQGTIVLIEAGVQRCFVTTTANGQADTKLIITNEDETADIDFYSTGEAASTNQLVIQLTDIQFKPVN